MSDKIFDDIESAIEYLEKDIENNPGAYINEGEKVETYCENCKRKTVFTFLKNGKARCNECNTVYDVNIDMK